MCGEGLGWGVEGRGLAQRWFQVLGSPLAHPTFPGRLLQLPKLSLLSGNPCYGTALLCPISHSSPNLHLGGVKRLSFPFKRILFPGYSALKQTPWACQRSIKKIVILSVLEAVCPRNLCASATHTPAWQSLVLTFWSWTRGKPLSEFFLPGAPGPNGPADSWATETCTQLGTASVETYRPWLSPDCPGSLSLFIQVWREIKLPKKERRGKGHFALWCQWPTGSERTLPPFPASSSLVPTTATLHARGPPRNTPIFPNY